MENNYQNIAFKLIAITHPISVIKYETPIFNEDAVNKWLISKPSGKFKDYESVINSNFADFTNEERAIGSRLLLGSAYNYPVEENYATWGALTVYHICYDVLRQINPNGIEFDFLNEMGYEELLDAYEGIEYYGYPDDHLYLGRLSGLLNPFYWFRDGIYRDFNLDTIENWNELNRTIDLKIEFMKRKGEERGYKYDVYRFKEFKDDAI